MLKPRALPSVSNHDEVFTQRYRWLRDWALRLTNYDQQQAQDLVHDTFVQFILTRPDLSTIRDIDGYLYTMLRNLHVSYVRRAARLKETTFPLSDILSISDTASVESELRISGQRTLAQSHDELCRICEYASFRKDTSKVGSIVILRFFHGYYPIEIAKVLRVSRAGVDKLLQRARTEANLYLTDPGRLTFMSGGQPKSDRQIDLGQDLEDLMSDLRDGLYQSCPGDCLSSERLQQLYSSEKNDPVSCQLLAHIVCCRVCLDAVNELLDLPVLSKRYPITMNRRDKNKRSKENDKGSGGDGGGSGVGADDYLMGGARRRLREVFDHRPKELRVSVNGFILGAHGINSEFNKLSVSAKGEERIGFVEVFSETDERLLFCVVEPPPQGPVEQVVRAELSDQRALELSLDFSESWPSVLVTYHDPTFHVSELEAVSVDSELTGLGSPRELTVDAADSDAEAHHAASPLRRSVRFGSRLRESMVASWHALDWRFLFRPAVVTAIFALMLIASLLLYLRAPSPVITASDLLRRAADAEALAVAQPGTVLHRTISLEEKNASGELMARRRVEVWQSVGRGVTARRLYDEKDRLVAGDWRRSDGVQTIYHHGARPQLQLSPEKRSGSAMFSFDNVWLSDVAAKEFISAIGHAERARVEEYPDTYVISYESDDAAGLNNLIRATLKLARSDLHAVEQTLVVRQGSDVREYRFTETSFERQPASAVPPKTFEPDPELLSSTKSEERIPKLDTAANSPDASRPASATATTEDEVEVLRLLNQAGVFFRDQVSVVRSPTGQLVVGGVVETDERKRQIVGALAPVTGSRLVRVEVETVAEVLQRQQARVVSKPVTIQGVEVTESRIPVDAELRKYLSSVKGAQGQQLDADVRQFAERMLARSNQARLHALALKPVVDRFSAEELQSLTPEARGKWRAIISEHVHAFALETAVLRRELEPVFPSSETGTSSIADSDIASDAGLVHAVKRLIELASANNEAVQQSFSISVNSNKSAPLRAAQFWRSLATSEALAAKIQRMH